jgi:hypothetical protein
MSEQPFPDTGPTESGRIIIENDIEPLDEVSPAPGKDPGNNLLYAARNERQ